MAKKKDTKATKAKQGGAAGPVRGGGRMKERAAAAEGAQAGAPEGTTSATRPREGVRDPRLPPPGTVIEKRDRQAKVRCKCTVEDDGIHYAGKTFRSLSGAAMAAAKDLGLTNKTQNSWCHPAYVELAA